jgi:hypothetical protein
MPSTDRIGPHIIDAGPAINFLATKNQRILIAAVGGPFQAQRIPDKITMRRVYAQLQGVNSGLAHIGTTDLLTNERWTTASTP